MEENKDILNSISLSLLFKNCYFFFLVEEGFYLDGCLRIQIKKLLIYNTKSGSIFISL